MTQAEQQYATRLKAVAGILTAHQVTARELAQMLQVTKTTALAAIRALERRGFSFRKAPVRSGERGPEALAYQVKKRGHIRGV